VSGNADCEIRTFLVALLLFGMMLTIAMPGRSRIGGEQRRCARRPSSRPHQTSMKHGSSLKCSQYELRNVALLGYTEQDLRSD